VPDQALAARIGHLKENFRNLALSNHHPSTQGAEETVVRYRLEGQSDFA